MSTTCSKECLSPLLHVNVVISNLVYLPWSALFLICPLPSLSEGIQLQKTWPRYSPEEEKWLETWTYRRAKAGDQRSFWSVRHWWIWKHWHKRTEGFQTFFLSSFFLWDENIFDLKTVAAFYVCPTLFKNSFGVQRRVMALLSWLNLGCTVHVMLHSRQASLLCGFLNLTALNSWALEKINTFRFHD